MAAVSSVPIQTTINIDSTTFVSGLAFRGGVNNALATVTNFFASSTAPADPYAYQFWLNMGTGYMQQRNSTNTGWNDLFVNNTLLSAQSSVAALASTDASGWINADETWTWETATSFSSLGDKTSKYQKGDKLKLTSNAAVLHGYIVSVTYNGSTSTTFQTTLFGDATGASVAFAAGAITNNYYSRTNALGFPEWINYTATATASSGVYSSITYLTSKFRVDGKRAIVELSFYGTLSTASLYITVDTPANLAAVNVGAFPYTYSNGATAFFGGTYLSGMYVLTGASVITFKHYAGTAFTTASQGSGALGIISYPF